MRRGHPKNAEGELERIAAKADRLAYIGRTKAPVGAEHTYRLPKTSERNCMDCGRPSYGNCSQCRECTRVDTLEKYVKRMRKRQVKLRILNGTGFA